MTTAHDEGYGTTWLRSYGKKVDEKGSRVAELLNWLFDGIYHEQDAVMRADWANGMYVSINISTDLATFDGNLLTRLVVGAHDRAIRVSIRSAGQRHVGLLFHPREREGHFAQRHPTIEDAIARIGRPLIVPPASKANLDLLALWAVYDHVTETNENGNIVRRCRFCDQVRPTTAGTIVHQMYTHVPGCVVRRTLEYLVATGQWAELESPNDEVATWQH